MKKNLKKDLRNKSLAELNQSLVKKRSELIELRFKMAQSQLKDLKQPAKARKEIAVLMTIISEKQAAEDKSPTLETKKKKNN